MQFVSRTWILSSLLLGLASFSHAQEFPSRPMTIVVPTGAGGPQDIMSRTIGAELSKSLGQPVIVEVKAGATGIIAANYVLSQPRDGHTILSGNNNYATTPAYVKNIGYDLPRDLPPFSIVAAVNVILMAQADAPFNTFNELVAYARTNRGKVSWGTPSPQGVHILSIAGISQKSGAEFLVVPHKTINDAVASFAGKQIQLAAVTVSQATPIVADKRGKLLAISGQQRISQFPAVPTYQEMGYIWPTTLFTFNLPKEVPAPVVDKMYKSIQAALQAAPVRDSIIKLGFSVVDGVGPAEATKTLADEQRFFTDVGRKLGVQPE